MAIKVRRAVILAPLVLTACATYHREPLPEQADLSPAIPPLKVDPAKLQVPGIKPKAFDASDGLDMTETVLLAVMNKPELKAARLQRGVRRAQLMQAGLLPDPTLSLGLDHPTSSGPGLMNAYNLGINADIRALLTRPSARRIAGARARQVDLDLLWQEWQVAEKARQLFVQLRAQTALNDIYASAQQLYAGRYAKDRKALKQGLITLDVSSSDLANLINASTRLRRLERTQNQTRHDLNALLGLRPEFDLKLTGEPSMPGYTEQAVDAASSDLPHRRPDLIALRAGYKSQEVRVRQAILEQFPSLSVGITHARDTSGINTVGIGVSIGLPIFDANRGHIAIERATRAKLRAEYQARLDKAISDADRVWREAQILRRQLTQVRNRIPELKTVSDRAEKSLEAGNLSAGTYINLRTQLLDKRAEAVQLESDLQQAQIALETLLGMPLAGQSGHAQSGDHSS